METPQSERRTRRFQETALSGSDKFDIFFPAVREEQRVPVAQRKNTLGAKIREKAAVIGGCVVAGLSAGGLIVGVGALAGTHSAPMEQPRYPTVPPNERYDHTHPANQAAAEAAVAHQVTISSENQTP